MNAEQSEAQAISVHIANPNTMHCNAIGHKNVVMLYYYCTGYLLQNVDISIQLEALRAKGEIWEQTRELGECA